MTVQEFYDDLTSRQAQQAGRINTLPAPYHYIAIARRSAQLPPVVQAEPKSDEYLNETDDPNHRQTVRQTDEFKDENPRGAGNRYNRS